MPPPALRVRAVPRAARGCRSPMQPQRGCDPGCPPGTAPPTTPTSCRCAPTPFTAFTPLPFTRHSPPPDTTPQRCWASDPAAAAPPFNQSSTSSSRDEEGVRRRVAQWCVRGGGDPRRVSPDEEGVRRRVAHGACVGEGILDELFQMKRSATLESLMVRASGEGDTDEALPDEGVRRRVAHGACEGEGGGGGGCAPEFTPTPHPPTPRPPSRRDARQPRRVAHVRDLACAPDNHRRKRVPCGGGARSSSGQGYGRHHREPEPHHRRQRCSCGGRSGDEADGAQGAPAGGSARARWGSEHEALPRPRSSSSSGSRAPRVPAGARRVGRPDSMRHSNVGTVQFGSAGEGEGGGSRGPCWPPR